MNVFDTYNCDRNLLESVFNGITVVGDRVNLPDGVYANLDDTDGLAAVIIKGRFIAELEVYDEDGEGRYT